MSFDEFLFGIALVVSALVSLLMLTFARSFLGFLGLLVGSVANYALMLFLAVFAAPYWAFAYSLLSLIAGALIEEGIADNGEDGNGAEGDENGETGAIENLDGSDRYENIDDTKGGAP